ncbi:MAG: glycogen/starch/alpha-glucan phosphorylase [Thermosynechococcaceae cyanobacterium]
MAGYFSHGDRNLFRSIIDSLKSHDPFMVLADYQSCVDCQETVAQAYLDPERWTRMSILNTAQMGNIFLDRAIREYCGEIWQVCPVPIDLDAYTFDAGSCDI